jgi:signal transduction histidine kinase
LPQTAAITEAGGGSVTQSGEAGGSVGFGGASTGPPAGVASADGPEAFTLSWPGLPDQSFLSDVNRALLVALGVAAVGALGLALLLARSIVRPVERLTAAARGIADGDLDQRVSAGSADEIGQLADAFNVMAESRQRLDGLRRNLVNDVAHELRSPLANLQGYLEVLRDGLTAPTPEILAVLHEESLQLNGLVADLQELALAEAGQLPLTREPVELRDPILKAIDAMRPQAESQRVTLDARLPIALPEVLVDSSRFAQILRNLLRNAVTHTPAGGRIDVSAAAGERQVTVEECDTGHGIEPQHLPHIFDRFYRADPARSRNTGGSGLGLAVVKNLVEAHGGTISVSSAVERGTTFTFTLPIAATVIEAAPRVSFTGSKHRVR